MKRIDKLREDLLHLLDVQYTKIKKAKKAHQIIACIDWLDQELFDKANFIIIQQQNNQYFEKNSQVDEWFDQKLEEKLKKVSKAKINKDENIDS